MYELIDLRPFLSDDKDFKIRRDSFRGTVIQNVGIGKYFISILTDLGLSPTSKICGTHEDAQKLELEIIKAFGFTVKTPVIMELVQ